MSEILTSTLTEERIEEARKVVEENPYEHYWDNDDVLTDSCIDKIIKEKVEQPDYTFEMVLSNYLFDSQMNYFEDYDHTEEVLKDEGFEEDEIDELMNEHYIRCEVNLNVRQFLEQPVICRFELMSNYDCMNSWFYLCRGTDNDEPETEFTYWGDVHKALGLDPEDPYNSKDPYVDYDDFITEAENTASGANLLTIPVNIPLNRLLDKEFIIPKGTEIGFFDNCYGGGACLDLPLLKDYKIVLKQPIAGDEYLYWRLVRDSACGYSVTEVYGTYASSYTEI